MKFYCFFCKKEMKPLENKTSNPGYTAVPEYRQCNCPYHPAELTHSYELRNDEYRLRWLSLTKEFEGNSYEIFLMFVEGGGIPINTLELGLWGEFDKKDPKNMYKILYQGPIPPDLTPENCSDLIKRVLNLKAFL